LVLGLELALYAVPDEAQAVFWYLDFLVTSRVQQLRMLREQKERMGAIRQVMEEEEKAKKAQAVKQHKKKGKKGKGGGGGGGKKGGEGGGGGFGSGRKEEEEEEGHEEEEERLLREHYELNVDRMLAKGFHLFLAAVKHSLLQDNSGGASPPSGKQLIGDAVMAQAW